MRYINPSVHVLLCYLPLSLFILLGCGIYLGGAFTLMPLIVPIATIPVMDFCFDRSQSTVFESHQFTSLQKMAMQWSPLFYAILTIISALVLISQSAALSYFVLFALMAAFGFIAAIAFGVNHELLHRRTKLDNVLHWLLSAVLCYPHYKVIHLASHHVQAATSHDKNTAWLGESFWSYWWRTIPQSATRAWQVEEQRLARQAGQAKLNPLQNSVAAAWCGQLVFIASVAIAFGGVSLLFMLGYLLMAHYILEAINYVQHYGLMRETAQDGTNQALAGEHSWDSYHLISNYFTYRVGHHSHHHMNPQLPYYLLGLEQAAPRLPLSYLWVTSAVAIPPLWRRLIHPILGVK